MSNISLHNNKPSVGAIGVVVVAAFIDVVVVGVVVKASEARKNCSKDVCEIESIYPDIILEKKKFGGKG